MDCKILEPCDVLVVGSGIAGTTAARFAASAGATTVLASLGATFSGSSFYPGTWGLGLVGPETPDDEEDLARTILDVGRGMADPALVDAFVGGIAPAIAELEALNTSLKRPEREGEREYVPCFDRKHRLWRGILRDGYVRAVGRALDELGVRALPRRELVDVIERDGAVAGALLFNHAASSMEAVSCRSVVLAAGGYGGLFERRLTADDVTGAVQTIALAHGCALVNLEFMQLMPGLVHPRRGIVFNEKTFRHVQLRTLFGEDPLAGLPDPRAVLEDRSGHGPFTANRRSRAVDLALDAAGPDGLVVRYRAEGDLPEFVRTYFDWLEAAAGIGPDDELRIAPYAHAANGGILIDADGATALPGLYACGEATGGMHGADRIGGLSSANGLVFGSRAGRAAATWTREGGCKIDRRALEEAAADHMPRTALENAANLRRSLQRVMSEACMVVRDGVRLERAEAELAALADRTRNEAHPSADTTAAVDALRLQSQLTLARAITAAALARQESRGAHYRADFPHEDPAQARPLTVSLGANGDVHIEPYNFDCRESDWAR